MKQIIQNLKTGETILEELPRPNSIGKNDVLIKTTRTLVSLGTERMLVEFGKSSLINKARQQPDKVKQVLDKIKSDGLLPTLENVFKRLEEPLPLGYCNVGIVEEVGANVEDIKAGDRVASNGMHAEYVVVSKNLVAQIPNNVTDEQAAFTVIGSIGLQGIRLCQPTFGETIVVTGLGLIGLLTAQMLKSNGCHVIGIDIDQSKCDMANKWDIETINPKNGDAVKSVLALTNQIGADGVIITASAKNSDIIAQAAQMSRKRGRIILVGVIGLDISRADFYEKELTFQVSCSYGPGRYDGNYENKGLDYPLPFVRWTEKRNFEAILSAISKNQILVDEMITERVPLNDYNQIYGNMSNSNSIASILIYPEKNAESAKTTVNIVEKNFNQAKGVIGIIGAGNFTKMTMMPILKKINADVKYIASSTGLSGTFLAKKYKIAKSTTDYTEILNDPEVDTVFVTTKPNSHAKFVVDALNSGKNVFVEKPLAITPEQLKNVMECTDKGIITLGFNRRFSPHIQAIKNSLGNQPGPLNIIATMNAGFIPYNMWMHDMEVGGGRIISEACHFIDLCAYIANSKVKSVCMNALGTTPEINTDNASILLKFENGSNAVVNYFANGSKAYSKERLEVFSQERTYIMDNFRQTKGYGVKGFKDISTKINKGHEAQFEKYINAIKQGGEPIIALKDIINVTKASFCAIESLKTGTWIDVD
jgi:predicted dehydrogenase/threonine dehydrogenase-like Zn-dependent dehydrogenase